MTLNSRKADAIGKALDTFQIELPSWGFANTGTRFGKFVQAAAASTIKEESRAKRKGSSQSYRIVPKRSVARIVGFARKNKSVGNVNELANRYGVRAGAINPNVFYDQHYHLG